MEYAVLAICAAALVVGVIILAKLGKINNGETDRRISDLQKNIADEFSRNRLDSDNYQKNMREETSKSLKENAEKIEAMTKSNYENSIKMTETITASLNSIRDKNIEQNEKQNKVIENAILKMQESNEKKLEEMRATVDEKLTKTLSDRLDSSFKTVSEQLDRLNKSLVEMKDLSNGVTDNVTALNRVLTNVKARGTWAEVQLEGILDQTIPGMYEKNVATSGTADRVEFAVKIPSGDSKNEFVYLPIDSKFPVEDYIRLCDASDRADLKAADEARKALEARVVGEAKTVTKYINIPKTTPFAIMYLATEGLYAEIISSKNGIAEKLHNEFNIMIAGPTTITALLNSLSMGFKTVAINEKANEVREILGVAKAQYDVFGTLLAKAKKKIEEAGETIDKADKRNNIIQKKLKGIDSIEAGELEKLPEFVEDNDQEEQ